MMMEEIGGSAVDLLTFALASPQFGELPRGDGHPVLLLPGLWADGTAMLPLQMFLRDIGYDPHDWNLGRNRGGTEPVEPALDRLYEINDRTGQRVSVIGWSHGGLVARYLALTAPEAIRHVVTLGAPYSGDYRDNPIFRLIGGESATLDRFTEVVAQEPSIPVTSIYSRGDGVIAWRNCIGTGEAIEVYGSHTGMIFNGGVYMIIADRLAQPDGVWSPFDRPLPRYLAPQGRA